MKTMTWLKLKFAIGAGAVALLVGAATVALSSGSGNDAKAQSYFLKGNLTYQVHTISAGEKEHPVLKSEFAVFVKGCTWKIRSWSVDNPNIEYQQTSFDGTNLYYTTKFAFGALVMDPRTKQMVIPRGNLLQSVTVEAGSVPQTISGLGDCYVWLAFASGCYFKSLTNNTVMDFDVWNTSNGGISEAIRIQVGCHYILSSAPPYLPDEAEFAHFDYASKGRTSETTNNMVLGAVFTSEGFTNFNGFSLPTKFKYEKYFVPQAQNSTSSKLSLTVDGVVSFLSTEDPGWGSDIPKKVVMIYDLRAPGVRGLGNMYAISNGILPALTPGLPPLKK